MSKNYKNNSKWDVHATDFEADLFTQGFVSEHTILVAVSVGCPSNGRRASSIAALLAPAAQTSTGETACSCLQWSTVLPMRPHRPYYSHRWPGHPSTHPHPSTAVASPPLGHSLPWSRRRPSRRCSRHGVVNVVNK